MDDGTLEQTDRGRKLRFERHLPHPPHKVWRALTDPDGHPACTPGSAWHHDPVPHTRVTGMR